MSLPERLFGTDGIRAPFGEWPLTREGITAVSLALGHWLRGRRNFSQQLRVIIGKDTRASGGRIERYLSRGFRSLGIAVHSCGVLPTPGLAYLTTRLSVNLGVMISASHNAAADNGIKCFAHNGFKLNERTERRVERTAFALLKKSLPRPCRAGRSPRILPDPYVAHLRASVPGLDLTGMTIALDCAHGAVSGYAERLFRAWGARVAVIHNRPNGSNINDHAGSLFPQRVAALVHARGADIGFSFDGDGDRVICVDEQGRVRDGDYVMAVAGRFMKEHRVLKANTLVATVMSNFGLEKFLARHKIRLVRAEVGDKYVLDQMQRCGSNLGGEQSGHIIFLDHATTGDGLLTAAQLLRIMRVTGKRLSALAPGMKKYPQVLVNTRVRQRRPWEDMPAVRERMEAVERRLGDDGRLVVRYSGTEMLARVMVEGPRQSLIRKMAASIITAIQQEVGADG